MKQTLIDLIYEAAFIPERWNSVLEALRVLSRSASSSLLIFDRRSPPQWKTTSRTKIVLERFATTDAWTKSERDPVRLTEANSDDQYFHCLNDLMTPEQLERDIVRQLLEEAGVAWQIGTTIPMPSDEQLVFTFERNIEDGRHDRESVSKLAELRPHLARAGLIATRLGIVRARGALDAMASLGLPAALLDGSGRIRDTNPLMLPGLITSRAGGHITLGCAAADAAIGEVLGGHSNTRSIAVPAAEGQPGRVANILPLSGDVKDVFSGCLWLLVMNVAGMPGKPDTAILRALFSLSPAESRLAAALATGLDLGTSAMACGIKLSTARSYLEQIFLKTGVHRQSELVALVIGNMNATCISSAVTSTFSNKIH